MMWGFIIVVGLTPTGPMASEAEGEVFLNRFHPQVIIDNRFMANNHLCGTRDYDNAPWNEKQRYMSMIEGSADSWMAYLRRSMKSQDFQEWKDDMLWRYHCWNSLDDFVSPERYGYNDLAKLKSLTKLKELLGPERFAAGWMPSPIPDYGDRIKWLQDLWTERTNFQGRKNALAGVSPLD